MCLPTTEKDNLFSLYVVRSKSKFNNLSTKLIFTYYLYSMVTLIVVLVVVYIIKTERKQRMLDSWDEIIEDENENEAIED